MWRWDSTWHNRSFLRGWELYPSGTGHSWRTWRNSPTDGTLLGMRSLTLRCGSGQQSTKNNIVTLLRCKQNKNTDQSWPHLEVHLEKTHWSYINRVEWARLTLTYSKIHVYTVTYHIGYISDPGRLLYHLRNVQNWQEAKKQIDLDL